MPEQCSIYGRLHLLNVLLVFWDAGGILPCKERGPPRLSSYHVPRDRLYEWQRTQAVAHEHIQVDHSQLLPEGTSVKATLALLVDLNNSLEGILVQRNVDCPA